VNSKAAALAKQIRQHVKIQLPDVKFTARTIKHDQVEVRWRGGPSEEEMRDRLLPFCEGISVALVRQIETGEGNHMQPWSQCEEDRLMDLFHAGARPEDIASSHGRSIGAIVSRLERLNLVTNQSGQVYKSTLWFDMREAKLGSMPAQCSSLASPAIGNVERKAAVTNKAAERPRRRRRSLRNPPL